MEVIQMQKVDLSKYLSPQALQYLDRYSWPGNIRQVANLAEYLSHVVEPGHPLSRDTLPLVVREDDIQTEDHIIEALMDPMEKWTLRALAMKGPLGRRSLYEIAKRDGLQVTETNLRTLLGNLEEKGLLEIRRGRSGSQLTDLGQAVASHLEY
tara:strand:- start:233 stop:691 length:459 start_codon:yes stop_codon:yes gene_type:complete